MAFSKQDITSLSGDQQEVFSEFQLNGLFVGQTVYWSLNKIATSNGFKIYSDQAKTVLIAEGVSDSFISLSVVEYGSTVPFDFDVISEAASIANPIEIVEVNGSGVYCSVHIDTSRISFSDSGTVSVVLGINGVLKYIEYQGALNSDLVNHVKVTRPNDPVPNFQDYGLRAYCGEADWLTTRREKIGPILTKTFRVNLDLVFNKSLVPREVFSNTKGVSYWEDAISRLFANNIAGGLFRDSLWTTNGVMEQNPESTLIKGVLTVVVDEVLYFNS